MIQREGLRNTVRSSFEELPFEKPEHVLIKV